MRKSKKENKDQLQLDFTNAVNEFKKAGDNVVAALQALAPVMTKAEVKACKAEVTEAADLRRRLNKIVGVHAATKGLHWREVWRVIYARLRDYNGFDPIVKGLAWNMSPMEACVRGKQLNNLMHIAEGMSGRTA